MEKKLLSPVDCVQHSTETPLAQGLFSPQVSALWHTAYHAPDLRIITRLIGLFIRAACLRRLA